MERLERSSVINVPTVTSITKIICINGLKLMKEVATNSIYHTSSSLLLLLTFSSSSTIISTVAAIVTDWLSVLPTIYNVLCEHIGTHNPNLDCPQPNNTHQNHADRSLTVPGIDCTRPNDHCSLLITTLTTRPHFLIQGYQTSSPWCCFIWLAGLPVGHGIWECD